MARVDGEKGKMLQVRKAVESRSHRAFAFTIEQEGWESGRRSETITTACERNTGGSNGAGGR